MSCSGSGFLAWGTTSAATTTIHHHHDYYYYYCYYYHYQYYIGVALYEMYGGVARLKKIGTYGS